MHRQDQDRLIVASLHAVATARAGWRRPEGEERDKAVAELARIATVAEPVRRGSPHRPPSELRADLLGQVAGVLRGFAPDSHAQNCMFAAELLEEAGADPQVVEEYIPIGRERREGGGPAFSRAQPIGWAAPPTADDR